MILQHVLHRTYRILALKLGRMFYRKICKVKEGVS